MTKRDNVKQRIIGDYKVCSGLGGFPHPSAYFDTTGEGISISFGLPKQLTLAVHGNGKALLGLIEFLANKECFFARNNYLHS